jgi:hypothetical protein
MSCHNPRVTGRAHLGVCCRSADEPAGVAWRPGLQHQPRLNAGQHVVELQRCRVARQLALAGAEREGASPAWCGLAKRCQQQQEMFATVSRVLLVADSSSTPATVLRSIVSYAL